MKYLKEVASFMKITKIEQQKNNPQRYSIYIDGEFAIGIDENTLIRFGLFKDMKLTQEEYNNMLEIESIEKIYQRALNYLSYSMRSTKEIYQYLKRLSNENKDIEQRMTSSVINEVISRLKKSGYLDDVLFGQMYVRNGANINKKGPNILKQELVQKGLTEEEILTALDEYSIKQEIENASILAEKYIQSRKQESVRMVENRSRQYLLTKGYNKEVVETVLSSLDLSEVEDNEESNLRKEAEKQRKRLSRRYQGFELKQRIQQTLYRKGFSYDLIQYWIEENQVLFDKE